MQPASPASAGRYFATEPPGKIPSLRHKATHLEPSSLYQPLVLGCLLKIYLNAQDKGRESSTHWRRNRKLTECSFPVTPTLKLHITSQLSRCSCESELHPPTLDPHRSKVVPNTAFLPVWRSFITWRNELLESQARSAVPGPCTQTPQVPSLQGGVLLSALLRPLLSALSYSSVNYLTPLQSSRSRARQKPSARAPSRPKSCGGSEILIVWNHLSVRMINTSRRQKREGPCLNSAVQTYPELTWHSSFIQ